MTPKASWRWQIFLYLFVHLFSHTLSTRKKQTGFSASSKNLAAQIQACHSLQPGSCSVCFQGCKRPLGTLEHSARRPWHQPDQSVLLLTGKQKVTITGPLYGWSCFGEAWRVTNNNTFLFFNLPSRLKLHQHSALYTFPQLWLLPLTTSD